MNVDLPMTAKIQSECALQVACLVYESNIALSPNESPAESVIVVKHSFNSSILSSSFLILRFIFLILYFTNFNVNASFTPSTAIYFWFMREFNFEISYFIRWTLGFGKITSTSPFKII